MVWEQNFQKGQLNVLTEIAGDCIQCPECLWCDSDHNNMRKIVTTVRPKIFRVQYHIYKSDWKWIPNEKHNNFRAITECPKNYRVALLRILSHSWICATETAWNTHSFYTFSKSEDFFSFYCLPGCLENM